MIFKLNEHKVPPNHLLYEILFKELGILVISTVYPITRLHTQSNHKIGIYNRIFSFKILLYLIILLFIIFKYFI